MFKFDDKNAEGKYEPVACNYCYVVVACAAC